MAEREVAPDLPDDAIINSTVCVVGWLDGDGGLRYAVKTTGDVPLSSQMGLLVMGMLDLYHDANDDPDEEP